jgi:hypothetical protein
MRRYSDAGYKVYIVYTVLKSNKLKLATTTGDNISANANFNKVYDIGAGFSYVKNSNTSMDFNGSTYYAFAVRSLRLKKSGNGWRIDPGTYSGTGLGGEDERFAESPLEEQSSNDFSTVDLNFEVPNTGH